ncbi:MAG: orotate phosphoribosyltransferase [Cytophagaceae bacterium]|jgi:orotate phosphoribosyltransferase|nr:orotate phosphoribosyltransferase [Cytophagaceae bacterium]
MNYASEIAKALLDLKAVQLRPDQPFQWASGWNSPIYCDNRLTLSSPKARTLIKEGLAKAIQKHFPTVEGIAGVATAGIPQGALVADLLNLPMFYVRPKPKDHGMGNQIEGKVHPGQKVVVIEDLVSTGGSSLKAIEALRSAGVEVLGMVAIFTYGFDIATENFTSASVPLVTLSNYESLLQEAIGLGYVNTKDLQTLQDWRANPSVWRK